jgi:tetratricopeptide (TPR) repeat protein
MTAQNNLDLTGNLSTHPLAELLVEILQARLNGSLRLSDGDQKVIVYFERGTAIFAISNSRSFRIFDILLRRNKIDKQFLAANPNYTNDLEFARVLTAKGIVSPAGMDEIFSDQIRGILMNSLAWDTGSWTFSPRARLRDGIRFNVDLNKMLIGYARSLTGEAVYRRFKSVQETFIPLSSIEGNQDLLPHEAFVLTRFTDAAFSVEQVKTVSGMPESATFQTLYTLWLGGFLVRHEWNAAFSENKLQAIRSAKLELKKEAVQLEAQPVPLEKPAPAVVEKAPEKSEPEAPPVEEGISLDDYLARSVKAETHYEMLGIEARAELSAVKQAYFSLAKRFHPDHFHSDADAGLLAKIQSSFTKLAQAYDVLKTKDSRDAYDFRIRKELAEQERRNAAGVAGASKEEISRHLQSEQAAQNFEQGFTLLVDEEFEAAVPYLARAVFFSPDNPRYRAYYGKALSADDKQRHKAESEIQVAIRLDPTNPTFKIILVEFFIQMNMIKRAEGELNRLLSVFPSNREARVLLDSLRK